MKFPSDSILFVFPIQVIAGNSNTYTAEKRELDPVLIGRKLRFFPYSHHRRTVCMRVEIYGCPWFVYFHVFSHDMQFVFTNFFCYSYNCAI